MDAPSIYNTSRRALLVSMTAALAGAALTTGCNRRARVPGVVIVGSSPTGVPFSFIDPWSNELTGSMIDTVRSVARQAGVSIELKITPFSALIPSLLARKIDLIAAALLRTPERAKIAAFSKPVYAYGGGVVVPLSDATPYRDLASLAGLRLGAQTGTRFVDQLHAAGAESIKTYENLSDMLRDLEHRRIDAAYGDAPILAYQLRIGARPSLRLVTTFRAPSEEALCFVFRPDDPLLPRFDAAIDVQRGTQIPVIARRWQLA